MLSDVIELPYNFDSKELFDLYKDCDVKAQQLYLTSIDGNTYTYDASMIKRYDVMGYSKEESQFSVVNTFFKGSYADEVFQTINEAYGVCRARFMLLDTQRRTYSYHKDSATRLHIPIITNEDCVVIVEDIVYRMPIEGQLYCADTRKKHTAANLGSTSRLHLVFSLTNPTIGPTNIMRKV